jgi:hypothetical protein
MIRFYKFLLGVLTVFLLVVDVVGAQADELPEVLSPTAGAVLQGIVTVRGKAAMEGFSALEVSFAYANDATETWFLLYEGQQPIVEGDLAIWDTTTLPDGEYRLRVRVVLRDGQVRDVIVDGLRVRNYSPIEANTPLPSENFPSPTAMIAVQPSPTMVRWTPTPLAANPLQVSIEEWMSWLFQGTLFTVGVFIVLGLYLLVRRWRH